MSALGIGDVRITIAVCDRISCAGCGFTPGNHDQLTMVADSRDGETRGFRRRDVEQPRAGHIVDVVDPGTGFQRRSRAATTASVAASLRSSGRAQVGYSIALWTPHGLVLGKAWQPNRIYGGTRLDVNPTGGHAGVIPVVHRA